jgi:hypothetical protein
VLRKAKQVYNAVGMQNVWNTINSLNSSVGDPPLNGTSFGYWSFREIMEVGDLAPDSSGNFSLFSLAQFIRNTIPIDTDQMSFVASFQELLTH